jgi:hypothetical protein
MTEANRTEDLVGKNDPAFPTQEVAGGGDLYYGLTKRELFAAMAMQGIVFNDIYTTETAARMAVGAADALLKELAK